MTPFHHADKMVGEAEVGGERDNGPRHSTYFTWTSLPHCQLHRRQDAVADHHGNRGLPRHRSTWDLCIDLRRTHVAERRGNSVDEDGGTLQNLGPRRTGRSARRAAPDWSRTTKRWNRARPVRVGIHPRSPRPLRSPASALASQTPTRLSAVPTYTFPLAMVGVENLTYEPMLALIELMARDRPRRRRGAGRPDRWSREFRFAAPFAEMLGTVPSAPQTSRCWPKPAARTEGHSESKKPSPDRAPRKNTPCC